MTRVAPPRSRTLGESRLGSERHRAGDCVADHSGAISRRGNGRPRPGARRGRVRGVEHGPCRGNAGGERSGNHSGRAVHGARGHRRSSPVDIDPRAHGPQKKKPPERRTAPGVVFYSYDAAELTVGVNLLDAVHEVQLVAHVVEEALLGEIGARLGGGDARVVLGQLVLDPVEEVGADLGKLRIAFTTTAPTGVPVHTDCVAAVEDAAKLCEELGHEVEEAAPQLNGEMLVNAFMTIWSAGNAWTVDSLSFAVGRKPLLEDFEPGTWALIEMGRRRSAPDYLLAVQTLQIFSRRIAQFMQKYDALLTPTVAEPPLPLGSFDSTSDEPMAGMRRAGLFAPFTPVCNVTGQPAMSVPLYWNADGLPIGAHFVGRFGDEATLFRLAAQLEAARPWANRRPPISVR